MKAKRAMALLLGAVSVFSVGSMAACGGGSGNGGGGGNSGGGGVAGTNSKVTTIQFMDYGGGVGNQWLYDAAERFETLKKNEVYETGKVGVEVSITPSKDIPYDTMNTTGYHVFTTEQKADIYMMASKNELMKMDDIVSEIAAIDDNEKERLKGPDGSYYALPHYEWFPGISYDIDFFDENDFYFAAPDETTVIPKVTDFGTRNFIGHPTAKKSCGPNGKYGDYDDGLPSSLEEFFILCAVIQRDGGRSPMVMSGKSVDYGFYFPHGLWANLAGFEQMSSIYTHNTNGQEVVEVITGWTNEELFYKGSNIYKPETEMIAITPETGYKAFDQAARFYSLAALHVMYDMQWFNPRSQGANVTAFEAQSHFISDGAGAMLWDSSYWYNETVKQGNIDHHVQLNPENPERNISYMPLPSQVFGTVAEGEGHENVLLDCGSSQLFVNKRVEANPGLTRAIKELLLFLYSDEELAAYTEETGCMRAMSYDFDETFAGREYYGYYENLNEIRLASKVVRPSSASSYFKKNLSNFNLTWSGSMQRPVINGQPVSEGYLKAMQLYGVRPLAGYNQCASARTIWEMTRKTETEWKNLTK